MIRVLQIPPDTASNCPGSVLRWQPSSLSFRPSNTVSNSFRMSGPRKLSSGSTSSRNEANTTPLRRVTKSWRKPLLGHVEIRAQAAFALRSPAQRHADQMAGEVVAPLMIRADQAAGVAAVGFAELGTAVRAAVFEHMDVAMIVMRHHHRDRPDIGPQKRPRRRHLDLQADIIPVAAAEDALLFEFEHPLIRYKSNPAPAGCRPARPRSSIAAGGVSVSNRHSVAITKSASHSPASSHGGLLLAFHHLPLRHHCKQFLCRAALSKVFLVLFFKKETASYPLPNPSLLRACTWAFRFRKFSRSASASLAFRSANAAAARGVIPGRPRLSAILVVRLRLAVTRFHQSRSCAPCQIRKISRAARHGSVSDDMSRKHHDLSRSLYCSGRPRSGRYARRSQAARMDLAIRAAEAGFSRPM